MKTRRRSGISNLIGAIFFVLVVGLVVATLGLIFTTTSGFIGNLHTSNSQGVANQNTLLSVSNMTFGGTYASTSSFVEVNGSTPANPLLPITNMNMSTSDLGWFTSDTFSILHDNASVSNVNSTSVKLPSTNGFTLTVKNKDAAGTFISRITLIADANLTGVTGGAVPGWNLAPPNGNNVTWYTTIANALFPGQSGQFPWSAAVPATIGTFYDTVVVSWYSSAGANPHVGTGVATVNTNTTVIGTNFWLEKGGSNTKIQGTHEAFVPGGLSSGYQGNSVASTSASGQGSIYVDFQPSINAGTIPAGEQLTGVVNITAPFTLQSNIPVTSLGCCSVSLESDLVDLAATPNALVYYTVFIQNATTAGPHWYVAVNPGGTNPTLLNFFGPTGWQEESFPFSPSTNVATTLEAGDYNLTVRVSMTIPSGGEPNVLMNFNDIGLSILPAGSANTYGSQEVTLNVGMNQTSVQGLEVGASVDVGQPAPSPNATVYLYAGDISSGVESWAEIGSATFSTSATIQTYVPLPTAVYYITPDGYLNLLMTVVQPGSTCSSGCPDLSASFFAVTASTDQNRSVIAITGVEGPSAVKLASLYVTGPSGLNTVSLSNYVVTGTTIYVPTSFSWLTGQTYSVTITTSNGLTFSRSFVAPTA